ncbi:MAG TPA: hypothetical protein VH186_31285 [Chloroflexia bacterium]|nr:hypothetical protein [Chloroflexia bacterium]
MATKDKEAEKEKHTAKEKDQHKEKDTHKVKMHEDHAAKAKENDKHDSKAKSGNHKGTGSKDHELKGTNLTKEDRKFLEEHSDELSKSTMRARWLHSADEHEERKGQTLATRSHEVIQHWAEERQAEPATVPNTEHGDHLGVLRFNFPGYGGRSLETVSWDEWFKTFDDRELVFIFQEHKRDGQQSNFFILDNPNREDG